MHAATARRATTWPTLLERTRGLQLRCTAGAATARIVLAARSAGAGDEAAKAIALDVTPRRHRASRARDDARPVLRRGHALAAADARRAARRGHVPARAHRRCAALRLARPDARFGAPLPVAGRDQAAHRRDGAAQAQRAALAPHRRPGLAHRDQALSRSSPTSARGACRRRAPGIDRRPASRATAASTRRTRSARSWPTPPRATSPSCPRSTCPGHAQAAIAAYPQLGVTGKRPPVSADWGVNTYLYNVDDATFALPRGTCSTR